MELADKSLKQLDVLLTADFPYVPPRIALVDPPRFLTWPHVERDGVLCLLADGAVVDYSKPLAVLENLLGEACSLIEDCVAGRNHGDFLTECNTYWSHASTKNTSAWLSLARLDGPSRFLKIWHEKDRGIAADSEGELLEWVKHYSGRADARVDELSTGLFLWLDAPLIPAAFPRTAAELRELVRAQGGNALEMLESLVDDRTKSLAVVLAAAMQAGASIGVVIASKPTETGHGAAKRGQMRGFRPGHVPKSVTRSQFFGSKAVQLVDVWRADAPWIHGRESDSRVVRLRASSVAIIGCGSVGASVAVLLAQAGLGAFVFVDPENLTPPNTSRHPLGARSVGHRKASALASKVTADFPNTQSVTALPHRWDQLSDADRQSVADCNVILSAIGNINVELALNDWARTFNGGRPVVYAWLEAFACAAHAVAILRDGGCLECGFDAGSQPLLTATDWPAGTTTRREPGCAATFQPYGSIELMAGVSAVAELVLDCLLGQVDVSTHKVNVTSERRLKEYGGQWSEKWLVLTNRKEGDFSLTRAWDPSENCTRCHRVPPTP